MFTIRTKAWTFGIAIRIMSYSNPFSISRTLASHHHTIQHINITFLNIMRHLLSDEVTIQHFFIKNLLLEFLLVLQAGLGCLRGCCWWEVGFLNRFLLVGGVECVGAVLLTLSTLYGLSKIKSRDSFSTFSLNRVIKLLLSILFINIPQQSLAILVIFLAKTLHQL